MAGTLLTRRELIATFLGAPLAMSVGCGAPRLPLQGAIVGASDRRGHRLRDKPAPRPAAKAWKSAAVVIVGGGVAGLAAAWRLQRQGVKDFVLLELESQIGGNSRSGTSSVAAFPWGAHYLPMPMRDNELLVQLLDEMQILEGVDATGEPQAAEQYLCRDPEERLFSQGEWHEGLFPAHLASREDREQLARFRQQIDELAVWRDDAGRRAFSIPSSQSSDDPRWAALDGTTFAAWMDREGFSAPRLRWLADYACRDDYGMTVDQTSAWAGLFYFASRVRERGNDSQPLLTWPEGNGRLIRHLSQGLEGRIQTDCLVTSIEPHEDRVEVIGLQGDGEESFGVRARRVICAAPQFVARRLVAFDKDRDASASEFQYGSWMVANLHLTGRPRSLGFPICWDNVIETSPSLGYVVATHQTGPEAGPTVWTYYYPLCDEDPHAARSRLLQLNWSEWADLCLTDLEQAHPDLRDHVERLDVMRWGHAMVLPRPGFHTGRARRAAAEPYRGIHFAHSDLSGLSLFEEAFAHGCRAAEAVVGELKRA